VCIDESTQNAANEVDIYEIDVTAIREMRCMAEGIIAYKNYTIFYSPRN